jgi:hypothetical protein
LTEGVIHTVVDGETQHNEWTKVKHVPHARVVAVFDGAWKGRIRWRRVGVKSYPDLTPSSHSSPSPSHVSLPTPTIPAAASSRLDISDAKEEEYTTLLDMGELEVIPKSVRPLERQLPRESRRLWESVTSKLIKKEFSDATKEKVLIEQKQRDEAADRKRRGVEYVLFPFLRWVGRLLTHDPRVLDLSRCISRRGWRTGFAGSRLRARRPLRRSCRSST